MRDLDPHRLRIAMKFSLWAWAAYWPAMGLMLLAGGMSDPVSIMIALLSLGAFAFLAFGGTLRATASRNVKEFLIERPLYLVGGAVFVMAFGAFFPDVANIGLGTFSGLWLTSLVWLGVEALRFASGRGVFATRVDQLLILLAFVIPGAFVIFVDALRVDPVGNPAMTVAIFNWLSLAYPALLLLATKPLREPLRLTLPGRPANSLPAHPVKE